MLQRINQDTLLERDLLRALLDNLPDFIFVKDLEGRFVTANAALLRAVSLENVNQIFQKTDFDFFSKDLAQRFVEDDRGVIRSGRPLINREEPWVDGNGVNQCLLTTKIPLRDASGQVVGLVGISRDISEFKKVQDALQRQTTQLQAALAALTNVRNREQQVLSSIPSICVGIGRDGCVTNWNNTAEKVFGLPVAEVIGKPLQSLNIGWSWDRIVEAISRCRVRTEPIRLDEVRFYSPEGRERILGLTVNAIQGARVDGGVVIVGADVTEHAHLHSQLMLAQKMEALGQLAAGIAHEINTPTQYVGDNARFLADAFLSVRRALTQYAKAFQAARQGPLPPELQAETEQVIAEADLEYLTAEIPRALDQSLDGLNRVGKIVLAMKQFSHPDGDEKELADLNQAIESAVTVSRNEWKYVSDTKLDLAPDLVLVPCLLGRINQVVLNLIVNAAHAIADVVGDGSRGKGLIRISTQSLEGKVEIRVSDSGTGIPKAVRSKIFDPFFTTKDVGKGTGQGLALAHNIIVEQHGGTITFETEEGKGTTFIIGLPVDPGPARAGPATPS